MKLLERISPRAWLIILLGIWWVVNLLQAGFTGLADDEAYYYIFSLRPAWGYFDHPPVTAWLVWLGRAIFGDTVFGVRFFITVLQPLYLYILFTLIRPDKYKRRDVVIFVMVCAALPILQLYGFIAVPDGPLLIGSALFLLAFKWFTERSGLWQAVALGVSIAFLAYCKYHGALVVIFALGAYPKIFKDYRLYIAGGIAVILLLPHLLWQYDHDWASFQYHLAGRNRPFRPANLMEYALNVLAVFNPLFWPIYIKAWRKLKAQTPVMRAIYCNCAGMLVFFLLSAVRGSVQPQWMIVSCFGFAALMLYYLRRHPRTRRYAMTAGWVTISLFVLFRIEMAFNPLGIKFEIFDNKATYSAIARQAAGRPVVFGGSYAIASKYIFYTGGEAYCQPGINYRTSQWEFIDTDDRMAGQEVLVEVGTKGAKMPQKAKKINLANGKQFAYLTVNDFRPVRKIEIMPEGGLPPKVSPGQQTELKMEIYNPYRYSIMVSEDSQCDLAIVLRHKSERYFEEYPLPFTDLELSPWGRRNVQCAFTFPDTLQPGEYSVGFVVRNAPLGYWFNSPVSKIVVQ